MKKSSVYFSTILIFMSCFVFGQNSEYISRIDPPNWFSGMKTSEVELLFYTNDSKEMSISLTPESAKYATIKSVEKSKLNNYYYVNLSILSQPKSNYLFFEISKAGHPATAVHPYSINPKVTLPQGLSQADAIYMVFPDRFANGDASNDAVANYFQGAQRNELKGRRGGDLKGINNHLEYIAVMQQPTLI